MFSMAGSGLREPTAEYFEICKIQARDLKRHSAIAV